MNPTPRVNANVLPQYYGKTVRVIGKIIGITNDMLQLQSSDNQQINVRSQNASSGEYGSNYEIGTVIEIIGRCGEDGIVEEFNSINFGDKFDLDNYDMLIKLWNGKYAHLFI